VHDLLGRKNQWIAELAVKSDGSVRFRSGALPVWLEKLGKYRLSPSPTLLQEIEADCQVFLNTEIYGRKTNEIALSSFYHVSFYPYWWGLLDLYEVTGKAAYLTDAEEGAFHTMAGVFAHPMPPAGNVTVHPGGTFLGTTEIIWWKGPVRYRLGWPRTPGDTPEHSVPAWLVSPVGFSLEQPTTYYHNSTTNPPLNMQMMAAWAPHLMRLHRYTGRAIYQTYARNAIIGRFGNDPGYYNRGFTDTYLDPQYPYVGPDISSFYYHHMPCRLAYVIDYLMAQAESWSNGRIVFPWVKQQGYVWFTNRLFGSAPGTRYGQTGAWPWLDRTVAQIDSEQVDWFLARSPEHFWIVMMNQGAAPVTVNVNTQAVALGIVTAQPVVVYENDQPRSGSLSYGSPMAVSIPAGKLVALRFATQIRDVFPRTAVLAGGRASQTLAASWGTLHAFRTRSPFGADSLYVVLTGRASAGATARLLLNGQPAGEKSTYPYEFSVDPWPVDQDAQLTLELTDGATITTTPIVFPGSTASAPTAYEQWKTDHNLASNAPDNDDADRDGVANLLEYAFKMNPGTADRGLPLQFASNGGMLEVTFTKWRPDLSYIAETSTDLRTWATSGVSLAESGFTVTASVPEGGTPRQFLRLRVTRE
jgi:hypothetical protein